MPLLGKILLLLENNSFLCDVRVQREAFALQEAGYQVSVIAPREPGRKIFEKYKGIYVYRFPAPPPVESFLGFVGEFV